MQRAQDLMLGGVGNSASTSFPLKITIDDQDLVRVILEHLHRKGHVGAMRALERETGVEAERLGEDAAFLRALVLDGHWNDAITLIKPLRPGTEVYSRASFEIRKQEFLEMLEKKGEADSASILVKALQRLEPGSSQQEFNDLCYCLTLPDLREHPTYASWTPQLGRLLCFESLRGYLGVLFPDQETPSKVVPAGQLELLCKQACMYQAEQRRRKYPDTVFPRAAVGGIFSDVWAPKPTRAGIMTSGRGVPRAGSGRSRRAAPPNTAPAVGGSQREKRNGAVSSGTRKSRTERRPLKWVMSCVSGDRWDLSPRPGAYAGVTTSDDEGRRVPVRRANSDLKGSPIDLHAGGARGGSGSSSHNSNRGRTKGGGSGGGSGGGGNAPTWSDSAATMVMGTSFSGHRGVDANRAVPSSTNAGREPAPMVPSADAPAAPTATAPTAAALTATTAPAAGNPPPVSREGVSAASPSRNGAPPQLEQLTPRWPAEWHSEDDGVTLSSSSDESEAQDQDPRQARGAGAAGLDYPYLHSCSTKKGKEEGCGEGDGSVDNGRQRGAPLEGITPLDTPFSPSGGEDIGEGWQRAPDETVVEEQKASEGCMGSTGKPPVGWEISLSSPLTSSSNNDSRARLAEGAVVAMAASRQGDQSHDSTRAPSRGDFGTFAAPSPETSAPETSATHPPDPPTTKPARGAAVDEGEALEAEKMPRLLQPAGQHRRGSRPDQPGWQDKTVDRRLTEGGENTVQLEPAEIPPRQPPISDSNDWHEVKADTPVGSAQEAFSRAQSLSPDPGTVHGSGDGGEESSGGSGGDSEDSGESSRAGTDAERGDFDKISVEGVSRFFPTVVFRGSHPVRSVGFSSDGGLFAAGSNDRSLRICRAPSESEVSCAEGISDHTSGLRVLETQTVLRKDDHHRGSIYCLAFSPDSALVATGSNDKMVRLLRLPHRAAMAIDDSADPHDTGEPSPDGVALRGHTGTVRDLCFPSHNPTFRSAGEGSAGGAPQNRRLLTVGAGDFVCRLWDVEGVPAAGRGEETGVQPSVVFRGHKDTVFSCCLLPGGEVAVTGGADATVRVWDARTGGGVRSLVVKGKEVLCVRPWPRDPDRLMVTSHSDGQCFLWDMRTGRAFSSVSSHMDQTRALDFSPNGHSLLTASYDGLVGVCECKEERVMEPIEPSMSAAEAGSREANGDGVGSRDVSMTMLGMLRAHGGRVLQGRWRPTAPPAFITGSTDCAVLLWTMPISGIEVKSQ